MIIATFTGKDARIATFNSHLNAASPVGDKELGGKKKAADRQVRVHTGIKFVA